MEQEVQIKLGKGEYSYAWRGRAPLEVGDLVLVMGGREGPTVGVVTSLERGDYKGTLIQLKWAFRGKRIK